MEFPWVLVFDFGISKGCHTILLNFQGWKLVFSRISKGKVKNLKFSGSFQKIISSTPLPPACLVFFWNSPILFFWENFLGHNCKKYVYLLKTCDKMFQGLLFQIPFTLIKWMKGKTSIDILIWSLIVQKILRRKKLLVQNFITKKIK